MFLGEGVRIPLREIMGTASGGGVTAPSAAVTQVAANTSTGDQIVSLNGPSKTPDALIAVVSRRQTNGSTVNNARLSVGAATSSSQWVFTHQAKHQSNPSETARGVDTSSVIKMINQSAGILGEANVSTWADGQITLDWTDAAPQASLITFISFYDLAAVACGTFDPHDTSGSSIDVTSLGEYANAGFLANASIASGDDVTLGTIGMGFFSNDGTTVRQSCYAVSSVDNVSPTEVYGTVHDDRCAVMFGGSTLIKEVEAEHLATGVRFTSRQTDVGSQVMGYLVFALPSGYEAFAGVHYSNTEVSTDFISTLGIDPSITSIIAPTNFEAANVGTVQAGGEGNHAGLGATDGTNSFYVGVEDKDGEAVQSASRSYCNNKFIDSPIAAAVYEADFDSTQDGGLSIDLTTAAPEPLAWPYLAIGPTYAAPSYTDSDVKVHYLLDESSGVVIDQLGNVSLGLVGTIGSGRDFDGTSWALRSFVDISIENISIVGWATADSLVPSLQTILSYEWQQNLLVSVTSSGSLSFYVRSEDRSVAEVTTSNSSLISAGTEFFFAARKKGNDLYVDVNTTSKNETKSSLATSTRVKTLSLGRRVNDPQPLTGIIGGSSSSKGLLIIEKAISDADVTWLRNTRTPTEVQARSFTAL